MSSMEKSLRAESKSEEKGIENGGGSNTTTDPDASKSVAHGGFGKSCFDHVLFMMY